MRSNRKTIILGCVQILFIDGVKKNIKTERTIKVTEEKIYQKRKDVARFNNLALNGRFKARINLTGLDAEYLIMDGIKYKIAQITRDDVKREVIIEAGERM